VNLPAGLAAGAVGAAVAAATAWTPAIAARARTATNYRGERLPLVLGAAAAAGTVAALLASAAGGPAGGIGRPPRDLLVALAVVMVFAAGTYDDRQTSRVHGLRSHFAALARGRVTSGIVKLAVVVAAAALAEAAAGVTGGAFVLGTLVVAGSANLLNLLDVAPGRALKFGLVCSAGLLAAGSSALAWASLGETAVLLPLDVRERAMLGDAGANTVGFVLGLLLSVTVATAWLAVALAAILGLHAIAETITLSRVIAATPPLRWLDGLGRLAVEDHGTAPAGSG
jgi:hypothetical protein